MTEKFTDICVDCGKNFDEVGICCDEETKEGMHLRGHCLACCKEHLSADGREIDELSAQNAVLLETLRAIKHSMSQAQIAGNDVRREISYSYNAATEALNNATK